MTTLRCPCGQLFTPLTNDVLGIIATVCEQCLAREMFRGDQDARALLRAAEKAS